jgi:hypothetical protein
MYRITAQDRRRIFSIVVSSRNSLLNERLYVIIFNERNGISKRGKIGASTKAVMEEVRACGIAREDGSEKGRLKESCGASGAFEL